MDISNIIAILAAYPVPVLFAILVVIIGLWVAGRVSMGLERGLNASPNADVTLSRFFANLAKYLVILIAVIAALTIIGIDTTSVSGVILASGAALAFVLQGALGNLAAGVMLLIFRPYKVGDEVEIDGVKGVVQSLEMTATRMKTRDNTEIIVANGAAWGGVIRNHSGHDARRLDMDFGIAYDADIDKAIAAIKSVAAADPRIHADPAPWVKVVKLNESSVDLQLRAWCDYNDLRGLKASVSQPVKQALDAADIGIPYPTSIKIKQHVEKSTARDQVHARKSLNKVKT